MKSDALFYEMFQAAPQIFFELLQITPPCPYRFESLTVKTSEKRIDGMLEPEQEGQTIYFLEVQATPDKTIYYRALREVSTYFEQRPARIDNEWQAVVLWVDRADDPGFGVLSALAVGSSPRLISVDLLNLLKRLDDESLALNVLRPFIVDRETQVRQNLFTWVEHIHNSPGLRPETEQRLLTVLAQLIEQKFKTLSYKELSKMLQLTPLKEMESVREVIHEDRVDLLTKFIRRKFHFAESTIEKLTVRLQQLPLQDLETLFVEDIFDMKTLKELNAWLDERLPETDQS
jgi:predicted transposase/invertase (TIGR01784 family)